ncbi:MAG: hypothetical protein HY699_20890 [Deltaproteobacteria bacterium]|nr:hypothetical protein [Deltaproteobacteria bacterium]
MYQNACKDRLAQTWCCALLLVTVFAFMWLPEAHARQEGVTTLAFGPTGCDQCHSGGTVPTVELSGPAALMPASTGEYTVRVFAVGAQNKAGFNASSELGTLATGGSAAEGTRALPGTGGRAEITHRLPKAMADGVTTFTFLWTAPEVFSGASVNVWGNAVDGTGGTQGDRAAFASITILNAALATPTPTPTATATPTSATPGLCAGDCDGGAEVTVDELVTGVNIALGNLALAACPAFDTTIDGEVTIEELVAAVNAALAGCP